MSEEAVVTKGLLVVLFSLARTTLAESSEDDCLKVHMTRNFLLAYSKELSK